MFNAHTAMLISIRRSVLFYTLSIDASALHLFAERSAARRTGRSGRKGSRAAPEGTEGGGACRTVPSLEIMKCKDAATPEL